MYEPQLLYAHNWQQETPEVVFFIKSLFGLLARPTDH
jgi:hypothetical protein